MNLIQVVFIFIGLSLDAFVVMMKKGATICDLTPKKGLLFTLVYSVVDVAAVLIGYSISFLFKNLLIERFEIFLACLIIFAMGCYICTKSYKDNQFEERLDKSFDIKQCFKVAIATSLDTLFLGVGFSFLGIGLLQAVGLSFLITFVTILVALAIGYFQGARYQRVVGMSGGGLMIAFSLVILVNYVLLR